MQTQKIIALLLLVTSLGVNALAAQEEDSKKQPEAPVGTTTRAKGSLALRHVLTGGQYQVAAQGSRYFKDSWFHMGIEAMYQGSYVYTNGSAFSALLLLGVEKAMKPIVFGGTVGAGAGFFNNVPGLTNYSMSAVVQPEAYLGVVLGGGFRVVASTGYTAYLAQGSFNGAVVGIRVDHKTETTVVGIDD